MSKLKVLLVAYYWPPAGGGGVQRWLKMSKYFHESEIDLFVYTPSNPEYPAIDADGVDEVSDKIRVIKRPIIEPYGIYKKWLGKKKDEKIYSAFIEKKKTWKHKLAIWFRGNFFIPDARMLWIKPSIKFLNKYLVKEGINIVITTGPPHSMHMIGLGLKKRQAKLKWIADFRDPWTNIDFYDQLRLSKRADRKHKKLEKQVLGLADKVVTVGWTCAKDLKELAGGKPIDIITNGYDHIDFKGDVALQDDFNFLHLGSMNQDRNPDVFWSALEKIRTSHPSIYKTLNIDILGQADLSVQKSVDKLDLKEKVNFLDFVPHKQAMFKLRSSHFLLLVINNTPSAQGIMTGKVFEYLGAGRPIVCIGPKEGDVKNLLSEIETAYYVDYGDIDNCVKVILELVDKSPIKTNISKESAQFTRQNLAKKYSEIIKTLR